MGIVLEGEFFSCTIIETPNLNPSIPDNYADNEHTNNSSYQVGHTPDIRQTSTQPEKEKRNINVRAALIHVIGDLVQSVGVLMAAYIIKYKVGIY